MAEPERLSDRLREFLLNCQGKEVSLQYLRAELKIDPGKPAWDGVREQMRNLVKEKIVKPSGRNDGVYKVIAQVKAVRVFDKERERKPPFDLIFPKDFDTGMELPFADDIIIREGDVITLSGLKNKGKTLLCLSFCAENIDKLPVLMGNEYTTLDDPPKASERFYNRLCDMDWIQWTNDDGFDKFTLWPVRDDYAEYIVRDRINIIDWINLDANQLYGISKVMEDIKKNLGTGIAIVAIQKAEEAKAGRGGQFTKDFTDCEILLDNFGEDDVILTVGTVKEPKRKVMGRTFAYSISKGIKIINFREIVKCPKCYGKGWQKFGNTSKPCEDCNKTGYVDKG